MTADTVKLPELPALRITSKLGTHVGGRSSELRKGDVLYTTEQLTAAVLEDRRAREGVERQRFEAICEKAKQTRLERSAANDGRASDFAFGYVQACDEIMFALSSTDGGKE